LQPKKLIKELAKLEGKKIEVSVGNIRELMACLKALVKANPELLKEHLKYLLS
jgi:hypothetical protein